MVLQIQRSANRAVDQRAGQSIERPTVASSWTSHQPERRHGPKSLSRRERRKAQKTCCSALATEFSSLAVETPALAEEKSAAKSKADDTPHSPTSQSPGPFNICFVTSEVAPWSKTGGLGDVCGSLPPALAKRGHKVMVVAPRYQEYPEAEDTQVEIELFGTTVRYYCCHRQGVDWVFVDHPSYKRLGLYGDAFGPFQDNQVPLNGSLYGSDMVFIANDWQAAMTSVYLAGKFRPFGVYKDARCVVAIHNLRHQGVFPPGTFGLLGLPGNWYSALEWQYPPHQRQGSYEEEGRAINTLKGGLTTADRIVAVSPGYAYEITTPEGGWGLEQMIGSRGYVLTGVLNGIDEEEWNPETDKHIVQKYSASDFVRGKSANKAALQKELGLPERPEVPLIGFIGRLDFQKGADLVLAAAPWLISQDVQLVCLGTGDSGLEAGMRWLEAAYPENARGWVGFNVPMSHKITAACDLLLMPSRFEPCGLNQLYAMKYGTVPVAHATGGLRDTVIPYNPWEGVGTGWTFSPCTTDAFISSLAHSLETFRAHSESFRALQERGMRRDSSWNKAAAEYEKIFGWAKVDPPYCG